MVTVKVQRQILFSSALTWKLQGTKSFKILIDQILTCKNLRKFQKHKTPDCRAVLSFRQRGLVNPGISLYRCQQQLEIQFLLIVKFRLSYFNCQDTLLWLYVMMIFFLCVMLHVFDVLHFIVCDIKCMISMCFAPSRYWPNSCPKCYFT